jgi:NTE family protein
MSKLKIGLALGSGSSRGWSHIGVINALAEEGITPDIVCGTSMGALVGASYSAGNLAKLEKWVSALTKFDTARLFEVNSTFNGFVNTQRLHHLFNELVASNDLLIEDLPKKYASVATDLETGREIWLKKGPVLEAVWSSISLPGLFPAIRKNDKWLVDGGLVNPVPVSVCRAMGADIVIAVNLNGDIVGKRFRKPQKVEKKTVESEAVITNGVMDKFTEMVEGYTASLFSTKKDKDQSPSLFETIASSVNITQDRITKSRMVGDPPDILLSPKLSQIGLLELYRGNEAIAEGEKCVKRMLPDIQRILDIGI